MHSPELPYPSNCRFQREATAARAANAIENHDHNLANPKHAEKLRLLLLAAGYRIAPGHASIHSSAEQSIAQGVSFAEAYLAGYQHDAG